MGFNFEKEFWEGDKKQEPQQLAGQQMRYYTSTTTTPAVYTSAGSITQTGQNI